MSKFLSLLLVVMFGCSSCVAEMQRADTVVTPAAEIEPSVYKVILHDPSTGEDLGSGTGFIVEQDASGTTLMTAAHVCEEDAVLTVMALDGTETDARELKVDHSVAMPGAHDLCLIHSHVKGLPIRVASHSPQYGEMLTYVGAPLGLFGPEAITGTGPSGGLVAAFGETMLVFTAPDAPGASGSPVVDSHGQLVGVLVGAISDMPGLVLCVPFQSIVDFLRT